MGINTEQSTILSKQKLTTQVSDAILKYKKTIAAIILVGIGQYGAESIGLGGIGNESMAHKAQERSMRLNHSFTIEELSREALVRESVITTLYEYNSILNHIPKTEGRMSKIANMHPYVGDMLRRVPQIGGVLLRTPDIQSMDDIKKTVSIIRQENPSATIVIDFEGGYVHAPRISEQDLEKYQFPQKILSLGQMEKEKTHSTKLVQFPSAEFIGIYYRSLRNEKEKEEFLLTMELYGASIARLFSQYGVNMILGPSLDITDDTIGTKKETSPLAKNDRAFSNRPLEVSALGNAFIRGTMDIAGFIAVPKHFVGTGLTLTDTDKARSTDVEVRKGAIIPFRDYINMHEIDSMTPAEVSVSIRALQPGGSIYLKTLQPYTEIIQNIDIKIAHLRTELHKQQAKISIKQEKKSKTKQTLSQQKISETIKKLNTEISRLEHSKNKVTQYIANARQKMHIKSGELASDLRDHSGKPPIIMIGNNDNNFYEKNIPGTLSPKTIQAVKYNLAVTKTNKLGGIGEAGLIMTDDLNAGAVRDYYKLGHSSFAAATAGALGAGAHILLFGDSPVADILQGSQDTPIQQLQQNAKKILDMKASLGIYKKIGDRYTLNPKQYNPTSQLVVEHAAISKKWIGLDNAYRAEKGKIPEISTINGIKNAITNSILSKCRIDPNIVTEILCSLHPNMYDTYRAPNEDTLKKQLIIVDKKDQMLYAYDLETRELIGSKPIAIGKGTPTLDAYNDKKIAGDKKTPVGYYMVVQKKDPKRIRDTIEDELYDEYGGDDGGMLVLAGSWQPQIAIHGTKKETVGTVSSGCVRMDNSSIREMMDSVPLGSMVIITN